MRHEFSRTNKRIIFDRAEGRCEGLLESTSIPNARWRCNAKLEPGRWQADHIDPDWISGRNDPANGQALCLCCHRDKTAKDQGVIAHVKRVRDREVGIKRSRSSFPTNKDGPFKKKMSGKVVRR